MIYQYVFTIYDVIDDTILFLCIKAILFYSSYIIIGNIQLLQIKNISRITHIWPFHTNNKLNFKCLLKIFFIHIVIILSKCTKYYVYFIIFIF